MTRDRTYSLMDRLGAGLWRGEARDALAQEKARVAASQALRLDLAEAGPDERVVAERERELASARMVVRGQAEGASVAHQAARRLARLRPVVAEQRGDVDLQQRAGLEVRLKPLERTGGA